MKRIILLLCYGFFISSIALSQSGIPSIKLISPTNGQVFNPVESAGGLSFRWSPIIPRTREFIVYRLKVWQLQQGQSVSEAMRSNQPIVTKDVDNISEATVTGVITGPCRPPYLCDFIWTVEVFIQKNGILIPTSSATPSSFSVRGPENISPGDRHIFTVLEALGDLTFRWTPLVPKPKEPVTYRLKVWQLLQGQSGLEAMRSNQPIATKDVDYVSQATISGIYTGPCRPPYLCDFIWSVDLIIQKNGAPVILSTSIPFTFSIREERYRGPDNIIPSDNKLLFPSEVLGDLIFRWTPIVPKPQQPVIYRLKVWQLLQGQNGLEAMRSNKPIVTKDVSNITEAAVNGIYTGPCRPPYLCDFIWNVEAIIQNNGTPAMAAASSPTSFKVLQGPLNIIPENRKIFTPKEASGDLLFRWTPIVPKPPQPVVYRLKVWQLLQGQNGTTALRTNKPIVTKDVADITEATVSGIYTGPCRPPYLCDFVWSVSTQLNGAILNSEPSEFTVTEGATLAYNISSLVIPNPSRPTLTNLYFESNNQHTVSADLYLTPVSQPNATRILRRNYIIQTGKNELSLDLSNCSTGIYILSVITSQSVINQKLIIQAQ